MKTADAILNEHSYKSPKEFAEECKALLSVNMLECPAYHCYIELKASRDIFIHNLGIVNELYINKVGSHARVKLGQSLPIDLAYYLDSYEQTFQFLEWLENELHETWPSSELEKLRAKKTAEQESASEG